MRAFRLLLLVLAMALPLAAAAQQITVSAAASLTDAFKELGPKFEAAKPGATVRFNFAASGVLLQQIGQGAPVDVFASADQATMGRAAEQKLIDAATRRNFASNALVLIEPARDGAGVQSLQDLAGAGVRKIAVGKTATVPVGRYTRQVLEGAGLWSVLEPKFVQADSVRQVLDYVARGEVEAGFVYRTDAAVMSEKVRVAFAPTTVTPVSYPVAVVADSRQKALAGDFVAFLSSDPAREVLARHGFGKP
ncbi:molybdate ABC transporter substrate-binding protein [Variovorax paradoxus]|uniref:Molybdate transport system substrate-binding protein n=1 Tax=Variovorax paradoxus TaxID=34073 RepID=A0AAW8ELJ0_VARPD|nr:molybdate ABC transporter substrate-binding protein [Variovorax paradoxus]MDP9973487.1 molybdate transport system substrate-binding protein [Variovorax paradoxus]